MDLLFFPSTPRRLKTKQHFLSLSREKAEQLTRRNHAVHLQTDRNQPHRHCLHGSLVCMQALGHFSDREAQMGGGMGAVTDPRSIQHRHAEHVRHAETYREELLTN